MYGAFGSRASLANVTKLHVNLGSLANFVNIDILARSCYVQNTCLCLKLSSLPKPNLPNLSNSYLTCQTHQNFQTHTKIAKLARVVNA